MTTGQPSMVMVREAITRSWSAETAYEGAYRPGVPTLGQCYPTARVLQMLFPALEIVEGTVWTGMMEEKHFWNVFSVDGLECHLDLTWQQFPLESEVRDWHVRDRDGLDDGTATIERVDLLLSRVEAYLAARASGQVAAPSKARPACPMVTGASTAPQGRNLRS